MDKEGVNDKWQLSKIGETIWLTKLDGDEPLVYYYHAISGTSFGHPSIRDRLRQRDPAHPALANVRAGEDPRNPRTGS